MVAAVAEPRTASAAVAGGAAGYREVEAAFEYSAAVEDVVSSWSPLWSSRSLATLSLAPPPPQQPRLTTAPPLPPEASLWYSCLFVVVAVVVVVVAAAAAAAVPAD